jgi:hypothetical protein
MNLVFNRIAQPTANGYVGLVYQGGEVGTSPEGLTVVRGGLLMGSTRPQKTAEKALKAAARIVA